MTDRTARPKLQREDVEDGRSPAARLLIVAGELLLVIGVLAGWLYIYNTSSTVRTDIVMLGALEDKLSTDGFLMRVEYPVYSTRRGEMLYHAKDGVRVTRGALLASVYSEGVDAQTIEMLRAIEERLSYFDDAPKEYVFAESHRFDQMMDDAVKALIDGIRDDDRRYAIMLDRIDELLYRRAVAEGSAAFVDVKGALEREAQSLGRSLSIGGKSDVYGEEAGLFIHTLDGYEDVITPSVVRDMPVAELSAKALSQRGANIRSDAIGKIIDNYYWYYGFVSDVQSTYGSYRGQNVGIRIKGGNAVIDGEITDIRTEGDDVLVIVRCSNQFPGCYTERFVSADVILKTYSGYRVPITGIRMDEDGSAYAYIVNDQIAKRRPVDVLYNNKDYAIVSTEIPEGGSYVKLYDEIIIAGKNLSNDKVVR